MTRRQFLGQGMLSGAALVAGPSLLGFFRTKEARAQAIACGVSGTAGKIPFLCFDLAGGASVAGSNVLVGGPGGQLDLLTQNGYEKLGLPAAITPVTDPLQVNTQLGLAFHADSAFLRGILSKASPTTLANTNGVVLCARSENDTGNNPHNPMYGINKAGADGSLVTLIGTESSESGGNSRAPMSMIDPAVRPTKVDRAADARGLVDTGKLVQLLNQQDAESVMFALERISQVKLDKMNEDQVVKDLLTCAYSESTDLVGTFGNPAVLDPFLDPLITGQPTSIFTAAEMNDNRFERTAAVMKLVVNGFAGAGTIELGGYDYHNGTRATGEVRDFEAGVAMGAALEYAARIGQQLMLYVFSDGSLDSDGQIDNSVNGRGKGSWRGDNSSTSSVFFLVYDPAGRPQLMDPARAQIGYFRPSGDIETNATRVSNNVTLLAEAIVLNYMALHNDVAGFAQALPSHGLGSSTEMAPLIGFQPIR